MFYYLQKQEAAQNSYHNILKMEAKRLLQDAQNSLDNNADVDVIEKMAKTLQLELPKGGNKKLP